MEYVTLRNLFSEVRLMRRELEELRYAILPEEKLSKKEIQRLDRIRVEMEAGKERPLEDVLKEL